MLKVKLPLPKELFPDPPDRPAEADLSEWEANPVTELVLRRLKREAYSKARSTLHKDGEEVFSAEDALSVIDKALKEIRSEKGDG